MLHRGKRLECIDIAATSGERMTSSMMPHRVPVHCSHPARTQGAANRNRRSAGRLPWTASTNSAPT
jgi:hypothetical protein